MPLQFIQTSFAECQSIGIRLIPLNGSVGIPPYYMTAYAIENTTIVSPLGDDPNNLSWQVQHPSGTYSPSFSVLRLSNAPIRLKAPSCSSPLSILRAILVASRASFTTSFVRISSPRNVETR